MKVGNRPLKEPRERLPFVLLYASQALGDLANTLLGDAQRTSCARLVFP